ncbi:MAG: DNA polymerase/3'-5' exonuclease PolX, partial [Firmicutes bacterium]|nr:DNA polymerase/3'-5' exonuclease PolX [Bacillota bacterium]
MHNIELAWLFKEIADLLEIKGENIFKIRAYQKAADTIATFSKDLTQATEKEIAAIPGFGKALQEKTKEWIESGEIKYLNTLRAEIPQGLLEIAKVPGLGPKLVRRLYEELGIENSDQLMKAAKEQKIRKLKGLGAKIELNIINNLKRMREHLSEVSLAVSYPIGLTMIEILSEID